MSYVHIPSLYNGSDYKIQKCYAENCALADNICNFLYIFKISLNWHNEYTLNDEKSVLH